MTVCMRLVSFVILTLCAPPAPSGTESIQLVEAKSGFLRDGAKPGGKLVLVAGGGIREANVPATEAKLNQPFAIGFDKGNNFYLVELAGNRVLKVDAKGILTILAGT